MYDLPAHHEMPINKDGQGPETNPELVTDVHCWCGMPQWPCPWADVPEEAFQDLHTAILHFFGRAAREVQGPVTMATFRKYLDYMFESKFGVFLDEN